MDIREPREGIEKFFHTMRRTFTPHEWERISTLSLSFLFVTHTRDRLVFLV